jgi:hypothetical protein
MLFENLHTVHTTGGPALPDHSQQYQCCTSYAVVHYIVLLTMGILMAETCWDERRWLNFICVASSWIIALPCFTMHSHKKVKFIYNNIQMIPISPSWSSGQSFWLLIMRSQVRFPGLPLGFFFEGEDPPGDHGLSSRVEFRFKAPPGTSYSYITIHLIGTT